MIKAQARRIDVLAANAGVYEFGTLGEINEEHFDKVFNTNARDLLRTVQRPAQKSLRRRPVTALSRGTVYH